MLHLTRNASGRHSRATAAARPGLSQRCSRKLGSKSTGRPSSRARERAAMVTSRSPSSTSVFEAKTSASEASTASGNASEAASTAAWIPAPWIRNDGSPPSSTATKATGVNAPSTNVNHSSRTPSPANRSRSQTPKASPPAPPAKETAAPNRAAVTATFAIAPPGCGTKESASDKDETGRSQSKETRAPPRHGTAMPREVSSPRVVHERRVEIDGEPIVYREAPGAPVLYVHGVP